MSLEASPALGAMPAKYLICTADDLGYSNSRDRGIIKCFVEGIVTRASLLVNGVHANGAARLAKAVKLPLGLHLNLTEGEPISESPVSLIRDGLFLGKFEAFEALQNDSVDRQDIYAEVVAQVEKFQEIVGSTPRYLDGHNHVHVLPQVVDVVCQVMREYSISEIRVPSSLTPCASVDLPARSVTFLKNVALLAGSARVQFCESGIASSDAFMGLWLGGIRLTKESIFKGLCATSDLEDVVELMVHPGFLAAKSEAAGCGSEADDFSRSKERLLELETLCDASVKEMLEHDLSMRLVGFRSEAERSRPQLVRRALILSGLTPATGNATTALRLRTILNTLGYAVRMLDAPSFTTEEFAKLMGDWKPQLCIAIHAVKGGRFIRHLLSMSVPTQRIIIIGGTDINCLADNDTIQPNLAAANLIVCFTESLRVKTAAQMKSSARTPIKVIPQSVRIGELPEFDLRGHLGFRKSDKILVLPAGEYTILAVPGLSKLRRAGLRPVKDPLYVKQAFMELQRKHPCLKLLIIGPALDPDVSCRVKKACAESEGAMTYMAPLHHNLLLSTIRQADVLLNSSKSEGMASTIVEAMALHTLVIARRNEGNSAVITHEVNGLLFDRPEGK